MLMIRRSHLPHVETLVQEMHAQLIGKPTTVAFHAVAALLTEIIGSSADQLEVAETLVDVLADDVKQALRDAWKAKGGANG